jgi:AraC-like DNA-binding protein
MQRLMWSTDNLPEAERFTCWRETLLERVVGLSAERNQRQERSFRANIMASSCPNLARFRVRCDGSTVMRGPRNIARVGWNDYFLVYRENSVGCRFDYGKREFIIKTGDIMVADLSVPFAQDSSNGYDHESWLFPRRLFDPHLPVSQRRDCLVLTSSSGLGRMVAAYLDALAQQIDALDEQQIILLADNFCRLLAVAYGAGAGEQQEAIRLARLAEAQRYINLHLADPGLTPEKAAAGLKISVRQLHNLFEPSGATFSRYLTHRRLEECRAALLNPIGDRSVTDIALAWGFNSLETFHRTFRQAFGATPTELRRNATGSREIAAVDGAIPRPRANRS